MELKSIFISNGIGVALLIVLAYVSRTRAQRKRAEDRLFLMMVFGVMVGCIMEAASYVLDGRTFPCARLLNYLANTYLFTINMLLPLCVLIYMDLSLYGDPSRIMKKYKFQMIVGALMILVNIVNFFVPISYYISPENVYERRPFIYAYYVVIIFYIASSMFLTHRYERVHGTRSFFSIEMFLVPILVGTTIQFLFYGLSLAWLSSAVGLVGLYMMQQNEAAYIDPLTEVYNRQYLNHTFNYWRSKGYSFSGIMIDLDRFKQINDTYGHSEGDKALVATSRMLKSLCGDGSLAFRFAGDEFVLLIRTDEKEELEAKAAALEDALKEVNNRIGRPYKIRLSYGFATLDPDAADLDTFMKTMDANMYEMKRKHHEK